MPSVRVRENEPFDIALRRFKRACEKAGILSEVRSREYYEKPCSAKPPSSVVSTDSASDEPIHSSEGAHHGGHEVRHACQGETAAPGHSPDPRRHKAA